MFISRNSFELIFAFLKRLGGQEKLVVVAFVFCPFLKEFLSLGSFFITIKSLVYAHEKELNGLQFSGVVFVILSVYVLIILLSFLAAKNELRLREIFTRNIRDCIISKVDYMKHKEMDRAELNANFVQFELEIGRVINGLLSIGRFLSALMVVSVFALVVGVLIPSVAVCIIVFGFLTLVFLRKNIQKTIDFEPSYLNEIRQAHQNLRKEILDQDINLEIRNIYSNSDLDKQNLVGLAQTRMRQIKLEGLSASFTAGIMIIALFVISKGGISQLSPVVIVICILSLRVCLSQIQKVITQFGLIMQEKRSILQMLGA